MLYMHNCDSHKKWPKAEDSTTSWKLAADTSHGGRCQDNFKKWFSFFISTSSYVNVVDRGHKTAEKTHSWETQENHFFEKTCPKSMADMM
jgi:hypothetical protein